MRQVGAAVTAATLAAVVGGCGLLLEAAPPRADAGAASLDAHSDLDAVVAEDARRFPLDAPLPDTLTPIDAPFGDVALPDAPFLEDTGGSLDAPFSEDAREDAGTEAGLGDDAGPMTCACSSRGGCDIAECVFIGGALTCVHRDDSTMCMAGLECRSGICVEPCDSCTPVDTCETATCVLGVCQRARPSCRAGEVCVGGACIATSGGCVDGSGTIVRDGRVCRPSAGACDRPEVCDGISPTCPPDRVTLPGVMCRGGAICDPPEFCDGTSHLCPDNVAGIDGDFTCYSGSGVCDGTRCVRPGDTCVAGRPCVAAPTNCRSGTILCGPTPRCEATTPRPLGSVCGPPPVGSACGGPGLCMDPGGSLCATATIPRGTLCRDAMGPCDPGEVCDGVRQLCPTNALARAGTVCRPSTGECDPAEVCTGSTSGCAPDAIAALGSSCGAPGGCSSCSSGDCVPSVDVGDPCPEAVGVCTEAGACAEGSCLVPGAPCAIGAMVGGVCMITGRADATTVCRAASANCEGDALCPTPSIAPPGDYSCPPSPSLEGAVCAVTCGFGVATGPLLGGPFVTACAGILLPHQAPPGRVTPAWCQKAPTTPPLGPRSYP